jgi:hypothetical protein
MAVTARAHVLPWFDLTSLGSLHQEREKSRSRVITYTLEGIWLMGLDRVI